MGVSGWYAAQSHHHAPNEDVRRIAGDANNRCENNQAVNSPAGRSLAWNSWAWNSWAGHSEVWNSQALNNWVWNDTVLNDQVVKSWALSGDAPNDVGADAGGVPWGESARVHGLRPAPLKGVWEPHKVPLRQALD